MLRSIRNGFVPTVLAAMLFGGAALVMPMNDGVASSSHTVKSLSLTASEPPAVTEAPESSGYRPERASFTVQFRDDVIPYRMFGVFVMPEEAVPLETSFIKERGSAEIQASGGEIIPESAGRWRWNAPREPGRQTITITDTRAGESITLNAFVMVPFDHQREHLNGYRIGRYQQRPLRGNPAYERPPGFVEVTPENRDVPVAPHFTLGQFVCKQTDDYPMYLVLREELLLKLETMLQEVNQRGVVAPTLHVMSGYRTPFYNKSIGNETVYSRHLYGDAADVYVDVDGNDYMDDLDGDDRATRADARMLARIVERQTDEAWYQPLRGGLGIYGPASHRGPFVHVDARGHQARW